jgi:quinol monooxygenase YgiN
MVLTQKEERKFMDLTIEMRARPGKFQELYQTLLALLPTIRKEKGCRECRIYRDVEDGEVFFLSGHWEAEANLEHYVRSTNGMALLGAIDLLSEKAAVKTGHDAGWEGIDTLKRLRKKI